MSRVKSQNCNPYYILHKVYVTSSVVAVQNIIKILVNKDIIQHLKNKSNKPSNLLSNYKLCTRVV